MSIFLLSAGLFTPHEYYRDYTLERAAFISGESPDLHYFAPADVAKLDSIYADWIAYMSGYDYTHTYSSSNAPNFTAGFGSPADGLYSYLHEDEGVRTLTLVQDLT